MLTKHYDNEEISNAKTFLRKENSVALSYFAAAFEVRFERAAQRRILGIIVKIARVIHIEKSPHMRIFPRLCIKLIDNIELSRS